MAWLNNGWVIGVGSGIISGVLVYWIVKIFSSRKDDKEYRQKLTSANKEVMYAIRPGISEGQLPDRDVIAALVNATARRYSIPPEDLFSPEQLAEELIKEVMDSSFLSAAKKREYCTQLAMIGAPPKGPDTDVGKIYHLQAREFAEYRRKTSETLSLVMGIMSGMFSAGAAIAVISPKIMGWLRTVKDWHYGTLVLIPVFVAAMGLLAIRLSEIFTQLRVTKEKGRILEEISKQVERLNAEQQSHAN